MAHRQVVDAVRAYLAAHWSYCPVRDQNEDRDAGGEPFLVTQFPVSRTTRVAVNEPYYREEGGIRLVLNMLAGEGTERPLAWAEALADLFRDKAFGGVQCRVSTSPFIDDSNDAGAYFIVTVVAPYTFDFQE